jgi:hypothetical protein
MRSESLYGWDPASLDFDLADLDEKRFAERNAFAPSRSWGSEPPTFSTGRVFLHPDQRQMRMPLVFRMVRHVIWVSAT